MFLPKNALLVCASVLTLSACGNDKPTVLDMNNKCVAVQDADIANPSFAGVPACASQMYAKYGHDAFVTVNGNIAKLALSAPADKLGDTFTTKIAQASTERQTQFAEHLLSFLESAYGSATPYSGAQGFGMVQAHDGLAITVSQYNYFVSDVVVPALKQSGVADSDISDCFAPVLQDPNFIKTVVRCK